MRNAAIRLSLVILLLLVWYVVAASGVILSVFLPAPEAVMAALLRWLRSADSWLDIFYSVWRVMVACLLAIVIALPVSLVMVRSALARPALESLVDIFRYIPVPALVPLTIIFFGVGEVSKIVLLFVGTFFQVVLLFNVSLLNVPPEYHDMFYSLGLRERTIGRYMMCASAPDLLDACRVAVGWCWTYVVIAELVAADHGVGHAIKEAQRFSDTPGVFAGIVVMATIGFLTDMSFRFARNRLFPYVRHRRGQSTS